MGVFICVVTCLNKRTPNPCVYATQYARRTTSSSNTNVHTKHAHKMITLDDVVDDVRLLVVVVDDVD